MTSEEGQRSKVVVPAQTFKVLEQLWRRVDKRPRASTSFGVERLATSPALQVASLASARRYLEVTLGESQISFQLGEATLVSPTIAGQGHLQVPPGQPASPRTTTPARTERQTPNSSAQQPLL